MQASFRIERRTSEAVVGEVSAMGNSTERNPLEWRANDYLVNIYIRMSRGEFEQMVQENWVVLVIEREKQSRLREKLLFAFCYFSFLSQLFSIQVVHALELRVTLHSRRNFSRFSHGRTDARGECKGQVDRTEERNKQKLIFSCTSFSAWSDHDLLSWTVCDIDVL